MFFNSSYTSEEKVLYYESIANLLEGGVTLLSALRGFRDRLEKSHFQEYIDNTIYFIESGDALNVAMRKIPGFYTEKEIAIIESGEQTGMISKSFGAIAHQLRNEQELRRKVIGALTYPFIIFGFLLLALVVVMTFVIPQIMPIIQDMTTEIPWSTRTLVATSNFIKDDFLYIITFIIAFGLLFVGYIRTRSGRHWLDEMKLTFPILGKVYKNYNIVQLMNTFSLLFGSGVSIIRSLNLTGASSGNVILALMFEQVSRDISHGKKITESFRASDPYGVVFSSDIIQMLESAERTSTLGETAERISVQYGREVDNSLAIMVKYIEPIALLAAGVFVLWFAVAIFSAIMQVVSIAGN